MISALRCSLPLRRVGFDDLLRLVRACRGSGAKAAASRSIRAAVAEAGQSVQGYILDTLRARLQADGQLPLVPAPTDHTPDEL